MKMIHKKAIVEGKQNALFTNVQDQNICSSTTAKDASSKNNNLARRSACILIYKYQLLKCLMLVITYKCKLTRFFSKTNNTLVVHYLIGSAVIVNMLYARQNIVLLKVIFIADTRDCGHFIYQHFNLLPLQETISRRTMHYSILHSRRKLNSEQERL